MCGSGEVITIQVKVTQFGHIADVHFLSLYFVIVGLEIETKDSGGSY